MARDANIIIIFFLCRGFLKKRYFSLGDSFFCQLLLIRIPQNSRKQPYQKNNQLREFILMLLEIMQLTLLLTLKLATKKNSVSLRILFRNKGNSWHQNKNQKGCLFLLPPSQRYSQFLIQQVLLTCEVFLRQHPIFFFFTLFICSFCIIISHNLHYWCLLFCLKALELLLEIYLWRILFFIFIISYLLESDWGLKWWLIFWNKWESQF